MSGIITDLWYGNLAPFDKCGAHEEEITHLAALMERNQEELSSICTPAQKELFQKYMDCEEEYLLRMMEQAFLTGFSLSCRIFTEACARFTK